MGEITALNADHEESTMQVKMLRQHLIEIDQEMEAESIRHERERIQMLTRISELEVALTVKINGGVAVDRSAELVRQELECQVVEYQLQLDNMRLSFEMLESSID
jgi:phosphomevalonate kinase